MKIRRKDIAEIEAEPGLGETIDRFIGDHSGLIFHETRFNRIVSQSFGTALSYLVADDDRGETAGICPLHTLKRGLVRHTYSNPAIFEIPYGGWVFDHTRVSLPRLWARTRLSCNQSLTYWSGIQFHDDRFQDLEIPKKRFQTAVIDLSRDPEEIFAEVISRNTRHNIRRAPRKGVTVERLDLDTFPRFCGLAGTLKGRLGRRDDQGEFYSKLYRFYFPRNQMQAWAARFRDRDISGLLCVGNRNVTHAWVAGRADDLPKNVYQNELLWWESIRWARRRGSRYYDLCVVEEERLPHIAVFKLGFSKHTVPFYHAAVRPPVYRVLSRLSRFFGGKDA